MNTNMTGLRWVSKIPLRPCALDKNSLSIRRVNFCEFTTFLILGAGSGLVPMYLTEIAPVNIRGAMGVLHQFALTLGILVSQVLGMRQLLGKF